MSKPKVLVVDDDPVVRRMVVRLVSNFVDIQEMPGGREALVALRSSKDRGLPYDLVVSDVDMPDFGGPDLLSAALLEGLLPREAFIFMSGSQTGDRVRQLVGSGVLVMQKPFDTAYFMGAVESRLSDLALTKFRRVARVVT